MLKQKDYAVADTNLANFGTELELNIKKEAAQSEEAFKGAGQEVGLQVWRVKDFKLQEVKEDHGRFYEGDSYLCLHTYKAKTGDKIRHDIHFWLGRTTTADEAGTAAYKAVELDDLLDQEPTQHREVGDHESQLFLSYFTEYGGIRILEGGFETGFNIVKPEEYRPRLLKLKGKKHIRTKEVPLSSSSLNSGDVFILDNGLTLYQWNGSASSGREKMRAAQLSRALDDERRGKPQVIVEEEGDESADFWELIGGKGPVDSKADGGDDAEWEKDNTHRLFRVSDESGDNEFTLEAEGKVKRSMLSSADAFVYDVGHEIYVWIGKDASVAERHHGMKYAQDYLHSHPERSPFLPLTLIYEGGENEVFESSFD